MRWVKWPLRALVAAALLAAAGTLWLLGTESGLRWALRFAPPKLQIEGTRGALAGTMFFDRVAYQGSEARNVSLDLNLLALATDTIAVDFVRIDALRLQRPEGSRGGSAVLPFRLRIAEAEVRSLVYEGYEIHDLRASYKGSASGHEAQASFAAAGARARVSAVLGGDLFVKNFAADLTGFNLAVLDPELPQTALQAQLSVRGPLQAVAGTLALVNPQPGPLDRERLPFTRIDAAIATDFKVLTVHGVKAALHPRGTLQGKGSASLERQAFEVRVADLDLRGLYSSLRETRLSGPLALELTPARQRVKGTLAQEDMRLAAEAERAGDEIEIRALHARAGESEATGKGRIHLGHPLRFSVDARLARFDPARFGDYPAGSINGTLQASGNLGGSGAARWQIADSTLLEQKFESRGSARLAGERIVDADAWAVLGKNRASAKGSFGAAGDRVAWTVHVPDLAALAADYGGEIRAQGVAGGTWKQPRTTVSAQATQLRLTDRLVFETASVEGAGGLEQHAVTITARGSDLDFTASLRGGWRGDAWRGEIASLRNTGAYPLELRTPAALEAGTKRVALGRFEAELAGARAAVESVRWQEGRLTSSGSIAALSAQWVLDALRIDKVTGDLRVDGDWALASTPKLNGRLGLRRASGDLVYGDVPLELSHATVEARFTEDAVAGTIRLATRIASARVEGKADGLTPESALAATAEVELAELRQLTEPLWTQARVSGRVSATLRAAGTLAKPVLSGTVRGDALGFDMPPWGIALRDGRLRAELEGDRLRVIEARIAGGEGSLRASGTLEQGAAALEWHADNFRVLGRPDRRLIASGKGRASFDGKKLGIAGVLRADSGHFELAEDSLTQLDDTVEIEGAERAPAGKRGPLPINLDLELDLGSRLTLRGYGYNGGVGGLVRVTTTEAGELRARGRVHAIRGASFRAYGQELEVDPGLVIFEGPLDAPALDISAWRRHQQVEAGIKLTGTLQVPRVELISNPPVSEGDKLSWLVLGRAPTEARGADLAMLQAASGAILDRGGGEAPLGKRFASRFGLDELGVRSSSELESNVVALGKRYDKLYFSFERAIGTTTEYLVKLDYSLTQRISLRGQTGTTSGVGFFYRYSWD
jgi:translocation and assembly module TamB